MNKPKKKAIVMVGLIIFTLLYSDEPFFQIQKIS